MVNTPETPDHNRPLDEAEKFTRDYFNEPTAEADTPEAQRLRDIDAAAGMLAAAMERQLELLESARRDHTFDDEYDAANTRVRELMQNLQELRKSINPNPPLNP